MYGTVPVLNILKQNLINKLKFTGIAVLNIILTYFDYKFKNNKMIVNHQKHYLELLLYGTKHFNKISNQQF